MLGPNIKSIHTLIDKLSTSYCYHLHAGRMTRIETAAGIYCFTYKTRHAITILKMVFKHDRISSVR